MPGDTIYALSSGRPPAAIAVLRVSGPRARDALIALAGGIPTARMATVRTLRAPSGALLDRGLVLWFPGPASATGEDVAEFHLHGGRAVVAAVSDALAAIGLRHAEAGEFTRRAVFNGRLDLNEAEGLADLLAAETETQRREAILRATGMLGRQLAGWTARLLDIAAAVERIVDHDEDDGTIGPDTQDAIRILAGEIAEALARPSAERLRDGIRVAIVGPVNAGKSSLFNALIGEDAAIVAPVPGTTRDVIERAIDIDGIPFLLCDTAGERVTSDAIEQIGIDRARIAADTADIIIDLSEGAVADPRRVAVKSKCDIASRTGDGIAVSAVSGYGLTTLRDELSQRAKAMVPGVGEMSLTERHRTGLAITSDALDEAAAADDPVLLAEHLADARRALDHLTGNARIEDLFDSLFSRFCLGK